MVIVLIIYLFMLSPQTPSGHASNCHVTRGSFANLASTDSHTYYSTLTEFQLLPA